MEKIRQFSWVVLLFEQSKDEEALVQNIEKFP